MTEEVTDAITAYLKAFDEGTGTVYVEPLMRKAHLAMRSASNSPTTNGKVSEPPLTDFPMGYRPTSPARPKEFVERAERRRANLTPRAASADEVERVARAIYDTDGYDEPFGDVSERTRERFIAMAHAAIAPNGDD